jgi:hypothetical protein
MEGEPNDRLCSARLCRTAPLTGDAPRLSRRARASRPHDVRDGWPSALKNRRAKSASADPVLALRVPNAECCFAPRGCRINSEDAVRRLAWGLTCAQTDPTGVLGGPVGFGLAAVDIAHLGGRVGRRDLIGTRSQQVPGHCSVRPSRPDRPPGSKGRHAQHEAPEHARHRRG